MNASSQSGSSNAPYAFPSPPSHAIGLDVGGTKIAAGLVAFPNGRVLARRVVQTQPTRGGPAVLQDVLRLASELALEAVSLGHPVSALGLAVCELVDPDGRLFSSNCIHWLDQPVREQLATVAPTVIEADVRAAALAEALFGAGQPYRNFLYVTVGTGISCCLMLDGHPYRGAHGATGTMGSSPLTLPCEQCGHVQHRTLEDIAAGPSLVSRFAGLHGSAATGRDVVDAATRGDPAASQIVQTASQSLGAQVALMINVLDPEAVIIGGGLGLSQGLFWNQLVDSIHRHIWSSALRDLPLLPAATGPDAGWIGAAARARQVLQ
jgi:glucokinase